MINQDKITKAWFFASRVHNGQLYPGEKLPYLTHLGNVMMEVMAVSLTLENPELAICCTILHDSIEDTQVTYDEVEKEFGKTVADGVMALSKNETLLTKTRANDRFIRKNFKTTKSNMGCKNGRQNFKLG